MAPRSSRTRPMLALLLFVACDGGKDGGDGDGGAGTDGGTGTDGGAGTDGGTDGGSDGGSAPTPVLAFQAEPPAQVQSGQALVGLRVELRDATTGARVEDLPLTVTVRWEASGTGEVGGTTTATLVEGQADFGELVLVGCGEGALVAAAEGAAEARSAAVAATPAVEVLQRPGPAARAGLLAPLEVGLVDAAGAPVDARLALSDLGSEGVALSGTAEAETVAGVATFDDLSATGSGSLQLTLTGADGCPLTQALSPIRVGEALRTEPAFLPAARVGEDWLAALPYPDALLDPLPAGLSQAGDSLVGVPEESGAFLVPAAAWDGETLVSLRLHLPVLPAEDALLPVADTVASEDGPWPTDALETTIASITTSRGTTRNVALRVAFPGDGAGGVAEGRFPVVAFHHAAHSPADIYDDYTVLHGHWASHGAIVASVDGSANVEGVSQSWQNLVDMSTFQLAAVQRLAELDQDETSPLFGHVDTDRVVVSGHSRGGGASLISLWREPGLLGAICLEPVSPLQTPSQDWGDPEGNGDRPFPTRPILLLSAALDLDEPWPLVDVSYEQTVGPAMVVTLHGANHEDSYDAGTPGSTTSTSTIPREARHALDQHYSTAFLRRFGGLGDEGGDLAWESALFGPEGLDSDLSAQGVSVHGRRFAARTSEIDDFQAEEEENLWGGANVAAALSEDVNAEPYEEGLRAVGRYDERGERIGQWARARRLSWELPEAELALWLDPEGGPVDLSGWDRLSLRVARDCPSPYSGSCPALSVDVEILLWDADGSEATVALSDGMGDNGIVGRHWSEARLDLDAFVGVDLAAIEGVALRPAGRAWEEGSLWVDDLRVE